MKINKTIINFARKHPFVSNIGYNTLKIYWRLKTIFVDYNHTDIHSTIHKDLIIDFNKNRPYGPKKRICYAPFNSMHFQMNGDVTACCFNSTFIIGNVNENSINEIWNGERANHFREKLENFDFEYCKSCEKVLQSKNYSSFPALKYDLYADDNTNFPTQMSFEISDLCNFECIMCNENLSSSIRKRKGLPPQKNIYPDSFFEQLKDFLPTIESATFIGGEPLLIKTYFRIWEDILRLNAKCTIHIQTNASYLSSRFLDMLETGQFDIGVSLDALEKSIFEMIRVNSNFETIQQNIKTLKSYMDRGKVNLNINFCPLTKNWKELPMMIEYCNSLAIPIKILNVESPRNLALLHRDADYINNIIVELEKVTFKKDNHIISKKNMDSYFQFINQLHYLKKEADKRKQMFLSIKEDMDAKFDILFLETNFLQNFTTEQKKQLNKEIDILIEELTMANTSLKEQLKFRVYYNNLQFDSNNAVSFTDYDQVKQTLVNVINEFYHLLSEK